MKRAWNYIVTMWQPASVLIIGLAIVAGLFTYRISGLVPGASQIEINERKNSQSVRKIVQNPVNAPYKTARYMAHKLNKSIASERLVSGVIAWLCVMLFYLVVKRFTGRFAALAATAMFATSTSLLAVGRLATPDILLAMLMVLLTCGYYVRFGHHHKRFWVVASAILGLSLYVPGMIYFIVVGVAWQFKAIRRDHKWPDKKTVIICLTLFTVIIAPLLYGFIAHPDIWREYLAIPKKLPTMLGFLKTLAAVPFGVFVRAPENPIYRLGRQPLLDIFASVMLILGVHTLVKKYRLDRLVLFLGISVAAILFTAVSGNYENSFILVPFIYLCIAIGIGEFFERWCRTFPRNPLAKSIALTTIVLAVLVSVNFQMRRYFIAWPHNAETRAVFNLK